MEMPIIAQLIQLTILFVSLWTTASCNINYDSGMTVTALDMRLTRPCLLFSSKEA